MFRTIFIGCLLAVPAASVVAGSFSTIQFNTGGNVIVKQPIKVAPQPTCRSVIQVTKTSDDNAGCYTNSCSLRAAINLANMCGGFNIVQLPAGTFSLSIPTGSNAPESPVYSPGKGDLDIKSDMTIAGQGQYQTFIDGSQLDRVIEVHSGTVKIANLTVQNGLTHGLDYYDTAGGGVRVNASARVVLVDMRIRNNKSDAMGSGGGIYNLGDLTMQNVIIQNNHATRRGGGLENSGSGQLSMSDTHFLDNKSYRWGGGAYLAVVEGSPNHVSMSNVTFARNIGRYQNTTEGAFGGGLSASAMELDINNSTFDQNIGSALELRNDSVVTINNSRFTGNQSSLGTGAAISSSLSYVNVNDSFFDGNQAIHGGAIYASGTMDVYRSTFSNNTATELGGAFLASGTVSIYASTFNNNSAQQGGAYFNQGQSAIFNSTISGNRAEVQGGGINISIGDIKIKNTTIAFNEVTSGLGGGIGLSPFSTATLNHTVIANNTPTDCVCPAVLPTSNGYNLTSDATCELNGYADRQNLDPVLQPLANNGGNTLTHKPATGSPLINAGTVLTSDYIDTQECLSTDQTGASRPQSGYCDIGAVEVPSSSMTIKPVEGIRGNRI